MGLNITPPIDVKNIDANLLDGKDSLYFKNASDITQIGTHANAEGYGTTASGNYAHAEGSYSFASEGTTYFITSYDNNLKTITLDSISNLAINDYIDVKVAYGGLPEFNVQISNINGLVVTLSTSKTINWSWLCVVKRNPYIGSSHAEGMDTLASGSASHAEGVTTVASGEQSHAEGNGTKAMKYASHAEGANTTSKGNSSHAEGYGTVASGNMSHAEGSSTESIGESSHAEGDSTTTSGNHAHAEGKGSIASGLDSHAEGYFTEASGESSHAQNQGTIAQGYAQTVIGAYNIAEAGTSTMNSLTANDKAFIIGNGYESILEMQTIRSNALTVDWSGNVVASGTVTATSFSGNASTATKLATSRTISLTGDVTGSASFDGSANASIATTFQIYHVGTTAPTNTRLFWVDTTTANAPILKYYTGSAWDEITGTWGG